MYLYVCNKISCKKATGVDTLTLAKKFDLTSLKLDDDKLDIDKLKTVPANLNNFKSKVDTLDVDKLKTVPVDLKR